MERLMAKQAAEATAVTLSTNAPEAPEAQVELPNFERAVPVFQMKELFQTRKKNLRRQRRTFSRTTAIGGEEQRLSLNSHLG